MGYGPFRFGRSILCRLSSEKTAQPGNSAGSGPTHNRYYAKFPSIGLLVFSFVADSARLPLPPPTQLERQAAPGLGFLATAPGPAVVRPAHDGCRFLWCCGVDRASPSAPGRHPPWSPLLSLSPFHHGHSHHPLRHPAFLRCRPGGRRLRRRSSVAGCRLVSSAD